MRPPGDSSESSAHGYPVELWQSDSELADVDFAGYWNDVAEERGKEWWVADGDFTAMEAYLAATGLPDMLARVADVAASLGRPLHGEGADLAAGSLWAEPLLVGHGATKIYAVEYSRL